MKKRRITIPKSKNKKGGRSPITVDWDLIDEMLEAGCLGTEIALTLGISSDTLYDYCPRYKKMSFSDYAAMKKAKGESNLRLHQYRIATNGKPKESSGMLIWLGKNRLNQRDHFNQDTESHKKLADLQKFVAFFQKALEESHAKETPDSLNHNELHCQITDQK